MMAQRRNVTDRAHRYRANSIRPAGPKVCALCGSRSNITVDHKNGKPDDTRRANLQYLCKSCNTAKGFWFKSIGKGRLTHQYNPAEGVPTYQQYAWAVANHTRGAEDEGGAIIHATPKKLRSEYAGMIADTKRSRGRMADNERWNPWPFSSKKLSARQTTPATGGAAFHSAKRKPAAKSKKAAKTEGGFFSVPDEETLQRGFAKGLSLRDMLGNPGKLRFWVVTDNGDLLRTFGTKAAAESYAKQLKQASGITARVKDSRKENPAAASAEAFEEFHGYPSEELVKVKWERHYHKHLAAAGDFAGFQVRPIGGGKVRRIDGMGEALICFNEEKNQLFVEGGDQGLSWSELQKFGIREQHEIYTLGKLRAVGYFTDKHHLGDEGGEAIYSHTFRTTNKAGRHVIVKIAQEPDLIYRARDEKFEISGGSYLIRAEGIDK